MDSIETVNTQTSNQADQNFNKLSALFPEVITESYNSDGELVRAVDKEKLQQLISNNVIDGSEERYEFTWPDKRKSIILANSSITKVLRPQVDKSKNFDDTKNIYIEGDNLDALKLLQESYLHKIDVIYIDPPYNTGSSLVYRNDFFDDEDEYVKKSSGQYDEYGNRLVCNLETNGRFHTDWLNMMYPRLKIAKNLLNDDGVLVLTIDDYEVNTITTVLDEIFGENNHLATIVIKNNPSGRSTVSGASISHEYALFYGANTNVHLGRLPRNDKQIARYKEEDEKGLYEWVNFRKHGGYKEDAPTMYYPIYIKKDSSSFRIPSMVWDAKSNEYIIKEEASSDEIVSYPIDENGRPRRWKWSLERARHDTDEMCVRKDRSGTPAVYIKSRMKEEGMLPLTVWDDTKYSSTEYGTNLLIELLGDKYFDYPKSLYAVMDCLRIASSKSDALILDFFSGSATTAHAVMALNAEDGGKRRFIMSQLAEETEDGSVAKKNGYNNICDVGEERIRKSADDLKNKYNNLELDDGFRVFKIDSSNIDEDSRKKLGDIEQSNLLESVRNIKPDRTATDLLFDVIVHSAMPLDLKIEKMKVDDCTVYQYGYLGENTGIVCCFDDMITDNAISEMAQMKPIAAVFKDSSFKDSSAKINLSEHFRFISPETKVKVL